MSTCLEAEGCGQTEITGSFGACAEDVGTREEERGTCTVEEEDRQDQGSQVGAQCGYLTACLNVAKKTKQALWPSNEEDLCTYVRMN